MAVDVRREMKYIWKEYDKYFSTIGEEIIWFRFDSQESRWDDVYDEGGLTYQTGIRIPVLWIDQIEDPEQYSGEGRRPTQRVRFACSSRSLRARGIGTDEAHGAGPFPSPVYAPDPSQIGRDSAAWLDDRLNDIIFYDGRFYSVSNFQIRGRTPQGDIIIGIAGLEMQMDEFPHDLFPWNTPFVTPDPDYDDVSTLDLSLETGSEATFFIEFDGVDLTGSTWVAQVFSGTEVVAVFDVDTSDQSTGIVIITLPDTEVDNLSVGGSYSWKMTQFFDEIENIVYRGDVDVVADL